MTEDIRTHKELVDEFADALNCDTEDLTLLVLLDALASAGYRLVDGGYQGVEKQEALVSELAEQLLSLGVEVADESDYKKYKDGMFNAVESALFLSGMSLQKAEAVNVSSEEFMDLMHDLVKEER